MKIILCELWMKRFQHDTLAVILATFFSLSFFFKCLYSLEDFYSFGICIKCK